MQLLYVYIGGYIEVNSGPYAGDVTDEAYRVFKDVQLNFSNKFIFNLDEFNVLNLEINKDYIPNFFDQDGVIKSVSAIIGKNGTGKTSIIELIKWLQPDNIDKIPYKLILVYGSIEDGTDQRFTIKKNDEINCHLSNKFSDLIKIKEFYRHNSGVTKGLENYESTTEIERLKQIYYSPIFEVQFSNLAAEYEVYGDTNFIDISTNFLLEKDAEDSINGNAQSLTAREVLTRHKLMDVERQYELIKVTPEFENLLRFKKPEYIELIIDSSDYRFIKDWVKIQEFDSAFPKDVTLFFPTAQNHFSFHLLKHAIYNLIRESFPTTLDFDFEINELNLSIPEVTQDQSLKEWIEEFRQNLETSKFHFLLKLLERVDFVLLFFDLDEPDKRFRYANNTRCRLNLKGDDEIIEKYFKTKNLSGFIHFDWKYNFHNNGQLSSGEKAKFNLFSRFHSVLKKADWQSKDLSNVLILIDEGDTLFHPEWQRTYLNDLLKGLNLIFKDTKSIQIILTTHSPFVSSDLPWYNIIRLDKDEKTELTRVDYNNDNPTFAANIHDLFADSFYMDKGFVGEFAKNKINDLYDRISEITKGDNPDLFRKEIDIIGEPFVKYSLHEHLKNRINQL